MSLELVVKEKIIGSLSINYDELKKELGLSLKQFEGLVVTEEAITESKQVRANLNKVAKVIDDRRKELKKEFLKPYEVVEKQAKELVSMVDQVINAIDLQVKGFEEKEKQEKKEKIVEIFLSLNYDKVELERIFDERWLNKTYDLKKVQSDLETTIKQIEGNLNSIDVLVKDKNDATRLKAKYLNTLDLERTIVEYEQEKQREAVINNAKPQEQVVEQETTPQEETEEEKYLLQFEIVATKTQIAKLSEFLKSNNYQYRKL